MSNTQKRADEIIEETMRELYDELARADKKVQEAAPVVEEIEEVEELTEQLEELPDEIEADEEEFAEDEEEADEEEFAEDDEEEADEEEFAEDDEEEADEEEFVEDDEEEADEEIEFVDIDEEEDEEDTDEESEEADEEDKKEKRKRRRRKVLKFFGILLLLLIAAYGGFAIFFNSHFMFNTKVNGKDYSLKSVKDVSADFEKRAEEYVLTIEESDGDKEVVNGKDISLKYVPDEALEKLAQSQNKFFWIESLWTNPELNTKVQVEYDKTALTNIINNMQCLVPENQVASINAQPIYKDSEFVVGKEIIGTQIDQAKFQASITGAFEELSETLVLSETDCYLLPEFLSDSPEVAAACKEANKYLGAEITYDFNPETEVVNGEVIAQFVKADSNMEMFFDEAAVKAYIAGLAEKYDTLGKDRQFTTAKGNVVTVEGGDYGWKLDQEAEYTALVASIQNKEVVTREPAFSSRAATHAVMDMGTTYAEVDLTNQHMYFIKDGQVVMDTPVVTGNPNRGNATPQGTYDLTYKTRNATLRGQRRPDGTYEYETPVAYWMPFNRGIGFHDATWQSSFGGSRYLTNGSHGCINMPKAKAAELYDLIPEFCPVVCYF